MLLRNPHHKQRGGGGAPCLLSSNLEKHSNFVQFKALQFCKSHQCKLTGACYVHMTGASVHVMTGVSQPQSQSRHLHGQSRFNIGSFLWSGHSSFQPKSLGPLKSNQLISATLLELLFPFPFLKNPDNLIRWLYSSLSPFLAELIDVDDGGDKMQNQACSWLRSKAIWRFSGLLPL